MRPVRRLKSNKIIFKRNGFINKKVCRYTELREWRKKETVLQSKSYSGLNRHVSSVLLGQVGKSKNVNECDEIKGIVIIYKKRNIKIHNK